MRRRQRTASHEHCPAGKPFLADMTGLVITFLVHQFFIPLAQRFLCIPQKKQVADDYLWSMYAGVNA
jgi:hypothetical protein